MKWSKGSKCGNKACKHKRSKHCPECIENDCQCMSFVGKKTNRDIEHENVLKPDDRLWVKPAQSIYKRGKHADKEFSSLNQVLFFDYNSEKWQCAVCGKKGQWWEMKHHMHWEILFKVKKK